MKQKMKPKRNKQHSGFLAMQRLATAGHDRDIANCQWIARQQTLDKVALALSYLGWKPEDIRKFAEAYQKAERDFCEEVLGDPTSEYKSKDEKLERDMALAVAKQHIDDALRQILPEDMFAPYDVRYDFFGRVNGTDRVD